jgi:glutamate racemase
MWVPLVENNAHESEGADFFIRESVQRLLNQSAQIDTVVLACTHYPLLLSKIRKYLPSHIQVLSQGPVVSSGLKEYLSRHSEIRIKCSKNAKLEFFSTEMPDIFNVQASKFFGTPVRANHLIL